MILASGRNHTTGSQGFVVSTARLSGLVTWTFGLSTSKLGHGSFVLRASFLPIFSLLRPSILDLGSGTEETDVPSTLNAPPYDALDYPSPAGYVTYGHLQVGHDSCSVVYYNLLMPMTNSAKKINRF